MKALIFCLVVLFAAPAFAQQILLADVQAERAKLPAGKITGAQIGALLNEVVRAHVNEGWRLMRKAGGNTCPQPLTNVSISCDILLHPPSGHWVDVLSDAEGDGSGLAAPSWQDHGGGDMSMALLPVDVGGGPSTPPPVPIPGPSNPPAIDFSAILQRFEWSDQNNERRFQATDAKLNAVLARDLELSLQVQKVYEKDGFLEQAIKSPYLYAIIGGILTGKFALPDGK